MLTGTYYVSSMFRSVGSVAAGTYSASHFMSGLTFNFTQAQAKPGEKAQAMGNENSNGLLLFDRTTQGTAEGSHWYVASSSLTTTWVFEIMRVINDVSCICDGAAGDDNGSFVTCANELHNKVTIWETTATSGTILETDTPSIAEKCVAGWKNGHRLNTWEIGGTNTYEVARLRMAKTFNDARDGAIPQ
jgi:hypothetical protein